MRTMTQKVVFELRQPTLIHFHHGHAADDLDHPTRTHPLSLSRLPSVLGKQPGHPSTPKGLADGEARMESRPTDAHLLDAVPAAGKDLA